MRFGDIPEWFGVSVLGATIALLGWVGKQLAEWVSSVRLDAKRRRARLTRLLALIRAGDAAWRVQVANRKRLREMLRDRGFTPSDEAVGYDEIFAEAYPEMHERERALHDVIRAMTVHTFRSLNRALLEWLREDVEFRVGTKDESRASLATYLTQLEAHLLLWMAKYEAWIPDHPERALVYLADESSHGVRFPHDGAKIVDKVIG